MWAALPGNPVFHNFFVQVLQCSDAADFKQDAFRWMLSWNHSRVHSALGYFAFWLLTRGSDANQNSKKCALLYTLFTFLGSPWWLDSEMSNCTIRAVSSLILGNQWSLLSLSLPLSFCHFWSVMEMGHNNMWPSEIGIFHSALSIQVVCSNSLLLFMAEWYSVVWMEQFL